jgi:hypothetical protein
MGRTLVFGTVALVIVALAAALVLPIGAPGATSTTSTTVASSTSTSSSTITTYTTVSTYSTTSYSTTTYTTINHENTSVDSQHGLQLRLSLNANEMVGEGGSILVNASEFNSQSGPNNVTKSDQWLVQTTLGACPNVYVQPFGVAVYAGYYTSQNVSQGAQLQIFPITACPMFLRLVTGYEFQPSSDLATVLPGSGTTPMTGSVDINSTYAALGQSTPLLPGTYTVVAADEWGAIAFLYFQLVGGIATPSP